MILYVCDKMEAVLLIIECEELTRTLVNSEVVEQKQLFLVSLKANRNIKLKLM